MMEPQPDSALVADLAAGRSEAYAALYDRYGPSLLRVARAMLHEASEAEDAVQDVFVNLVRQRGRLALVVDWDAYLFAILRHAVSRRLGREQTERRHLRRLATAGDQRNPSPPESDESLQAALAQLPATQREIVILKIDGGLTFAQIAEILKTSPNTVASRYRYALEKLRNMLKESP
jgi:RNA polymerase sigma-70 factor (ECF subfamily)